MPNAETMTTATTPMAVALSNIRALGDELNAAFYERTDEVRCLQLATISGEHVLYLGPPGSAKSDLAQQFSDCMEAPPDANYFQRLLTPFSTPEEVFGPFSVQGLKNDKYERKVDGYLPTAHVAFIDECFKANSAILNSMLTALNEREFDQGNSRISIPLQVAIGASNELPQDASLAALYDRFLFRRWVEYIKSEDSCVSLLQDVANGTRADVITTITAQDVTMLRAARYSVKVSPAISRTLVKFLKGLAKDMSLVTSDRRMIKCQKALQASAVLAGRTAVTSDDFEVLQDVLWNNPDERGEIGGKLALMANPNKAKALAILDSATEAYNGLKDMEMDMANIGQFAKVNAELKAMVSRVERLSDGNNSSVAQIHGEILALQKDMAAMIAKQMGV